MHEHLEVIMPPTTNIEEAVELVMAPFSENNEDEETCGNEKFWDWYRIGGRYSGNKFIARFDEKKLDAFYAWMEKEHVTVSGFQMGKQELSPASQIQKVDQKWNEMFPSEKFVPCPIFDHAKHENSLDDILLLCDMPKTVKAHRVIIAAPGFNYNEKTKDGVFDGPVEASFMISESFWNGVSHVDSNWDRTVISAVEKYKNSFANAKDDWKSTRLPTDSWITITVDYHH